jgi:Tfp pilus assembly protein PilN
MIKINLVAEGRRPVVAKAPKGPAMPSIGGKDVAPIMLLVGFLAFVAVFGAWFFMLKQEKDANDREIAQAEETVRQLEEIIKQVEEFKRKEAELQHKIQVITDLKDSQTGPVRIMDEISKALPELLWLDRLDLNASAVTLTGQAFNITAVSSFLENIDKVPEFQEPILRDASERDAVYAFTLVFNFDATPLRVSGEEKPAVAAEAAAPPPPTTSGG